MLVGALAQRYSVAVARMAIAGVAGTSAVWYALTVPEMLKRRKKVD